MEKNHLFIFYRETDVFPVREVKFNCQDPDISYNDGEPTYDDFTYNADVPWEVVCPLAFCVPPFIVSLLIFYVKNTHKN